MKPEEVNYLVKHTYLKYRRERNGGISEVCTPHPTTTTTTTTTTFAKLSAACLGSSVNLLLVSKRQKNPEVAPIIMLSLTLRSRRRFSARVRNVSHSTYNESYKHCKHHQWCV